MELVYPIYLDVPMMTGFLASLEGGIVEEAEMERRSGDAKEKSARGGLSVSVSGLLSSVLGGGAETELARKVSEELESHYRGTVRYPTSSLFIRLRSLLLNRESIVVLDEGSDLSDIQLGDIVEFDGLAKPNPAYQIRHAFDQLFPIVVASLDMAEAEIDQKIAELAGTRKNSVIEIDDEQITIRDKRHSDSIRAMLESQKSIQQSQAAVYQAIGKILSDLFRHEGADIVVFESSSWKSVARIYPIFARNEQVTELHDAHWRCLGKVVGVIGDQEEYDLLKGSPVSYLAKDQFDELASSLRSEEFNIKTTKPIIEGPAIIVATMAIFA